MDTRRDSRSGEDRPPAPDLIDAGTVKRIDLPTVGDSGSRNRPIVILVVAIVGILAVVAMAAALAPRAPAPTAPAVGIASATPAIPSTGLPLPTAPTPTRAAQTVLTPTSTPRPAWAWSREDLLPGIHDLEPMGIWSVNGRVLALVRQSGPASDGGETWFVARTSPSEGWELVSVPPAIDDLQGASVIDDRLWFVAQVRGVTVESTRWELVSTSTGDDWTSVGAANLGPTDGVDFLGRVADRWVVATWWIVPAEGEEGARQWDLQWSNDGVDWHGASLPEMDGDPLFGRTAMFGETMVVLGLNPLPGRTVPFLLSSTDGGTWQESSFAVPAQHVPTGIACGDDSCVILASTLGSDATPLTSVTSDFQEWIVAEIAAPPTKTGGFLNDLTATGTGFLAMGNTTGYAFLSEDGLTWQSFQVIVAPTGMEGFVGIAVTGNDVVALVRGPDNGSPGVWTGTLPQLGD